ncbi:TetR/AcrR family transcriptional regulator [Sphingobium yanoikuyae]|uniref:TetR family transcriptional regulator n=1 Tax=Sphingobium yanoikuyae TaxID=13690 RepID=A0A291MUJ8_SPHYA|nr:TetR/AcrR family transcriptional regulator [Sphingobium yanoikuyae]ATI78777.1 TetR family transcriptional regulator [Sphingobium yanoikuyae]
MTDETAQQRRYKSFEDTHQMLIELAVGLIADRGIDALSLSALARAAGVNRTTIYYHFTDRDALVAAVKLWSSQQIVAAFRPELPRQARIDYVTRFVLDNPAIMSLWIEDFIAPGDIRASYPHWDALVSGIGTSLAAAFPDEPIDAEVYCVMLLTSALIGPRVFRHRVARDLDTEATIARFRQEQQRVLRRDGIADD